jgi:hypothetical protein
MSTPHPSCLLWLGLVVGGLAMPIAASGEPALQRVPMTAAELRNQGIDLRIIDPNNSTSGGFYEKRTGFPNKCYYDMSYELSISDAMLRHFEARGFSLQSLCLAMQSSLRYDPETGKQLPLAVATRPGSPGQPLEAIEDYEVLLNIPDCFKNGTPLIDCRRDYDASFGTAEDDPESLRRSALEEHAKIRAFIMRGGYARTCGCKEIRFSSDNVTLKDDCRLDSIPVCAGAPNDPNPAGRLVKKSGSALMKRARVGSSYYVGGVEVSPTLPNGYGYSLGTEGGDPEKIDVKLETLRKDSGSAVPWNQR